MSSDELLEVGEGAQFGPVLVARRGLILLRVVVVGGGRAAGQRRGEEASQVEALVRPAAHLLLLGELLQAGARRRGVRARRRGIRARRLELLGQLLLLEEVSEDELDV